VDAPGHVESPTIRSKETHHVPETALAAGELLLDALGEYQQRLAVLDGVRRHLAPTVETNHVAGRQFVRLLVEIEFECAGAQIQHDLSVGMGVGVDTFVRFEFESDDGRFAGVERSRVWCCSQIVEGGLVCHVSVFTAQLGEACPEHLHGGLPNMIVATYTERWRVSSAMGQANTNDADHVLDVREVDGPPFDDIMAALDELDGEETLLLKNSFEPEPLYDVIEQRGFVYETTQHEPDIWHVQIEQE